MVLRARDEEASKWPPAKVFVGLFLTSHGKITKLTLMIAVRKATPLPARQRRQSLHNMQTAIQNSFAVRPH